MHALVQALAISEGKQVNIYTDSQYAFATVHIHGAICKERGLLSAAGKAIKNKEETLKLLKALWFPREVAVLHCKGHQKGNDPTAQGNGLADEAAKAAASKKTGEVPSLTMALMPTAEALLPRYTKKEIDWAMAEGATQTREGW